MNQALPFLLNLQKKIKFRLWLAWVLRAMAFAFPLSAVLWLSGLLQAGWVMTVGVMSFCLLIWIHFRKDHAHWPTLPRLANHLNRMDPSLEESAELLLEEAGQLSPLQQLQRNRIVERLKALPPDKMLPNRRLKVAWRQLGIGAMIGAIFLFGSLWVPRGLAQQGVASIRSVLTGNDSKPLKLDVSAWKIQVEPPKYTKLKAETFQVPSLKLMQGSRVNWEIELSHRVDDLVVHHRPGESLQLGSGKQFQWGLLIKQPGYYYLEWQKDGERQTTTYFPLEIITDQPPVLTVTNPEAIRTEIGEGSASQFRVALEASDDFGLVDGELTITVAKGSGENVKFRERTWPLEGWEQGTPKSKELHAVLDFATWEATWGDELYFHVTITDNREPEPNQTRSDTYFLVLLGGDQPMTLDTEGMVLRPVKAYFRSQRQIIIDTEKLLAQREEISEQAFRERSENLGVDQKILRLRYGQFLGEEFETSIDVHLEPPATEDHHDDHHGHGAEEHGGESLPDGVPSHQHDEEAESGFQETKVVNTDIKELLPEGLMHDHDDAETSTFFEPEMKAKLKDALSEMWQSELYLRTIEPGKSLPYQYRALKMIKDLQQMSRVYEQRVGIETPPLQPEKKRLTGERTKMARLRGQQNLKKDDPFEALRQAWQGFESNRRVDESLLARVAPALEKAAQKDPAQYLEALEALNQYQRSAGDCDNCRQAISNALLRLLPSANPEPKARKKPRKSLSQSYLGELGQWP